MHQHDPSPTHQLRLTSSGLAIVALVVLSGIDFLLRNILIPKDPGDTYITTVSLLLIAAGILLVTFWVPQVEKADLGSIGFRGFKWRHIWISLLTYVILMVLWIGSTAVLHAVGLQGLRALQALFKTLSLSTLLAMLFTGPLFEEIFYRGYLIERVTMLTGKRWLAGILSGVTFTAMHSSFFSLGATIETGIFAAALVLLYLKERNIWPCIILHSINSIIGYLIAPLLW